MWIDKVLFKDSELETNIVKTVNLWLFLTKQLNILPKYYCLI